MIHCGELLRVFIACGSGRRGFPRGRCARPRIPAGATNGQNFSTRKRIRWLCPRDLAPRNLLSSRKARIPKFPRNERWPHVFSLQGALGSRGTRKEVIMRMIARTLFALGFAGTIAGGAAMPAAAQGVYLEGPGVGIGIGRPAYRERYYRGYSDYDYSGPRVYSGRSYD